MVQVCPETVKAPARDAVFPDLLTWNGPDQVSPPGVIVWLFPPPAAKVIFAPPVVSAVLVKVISPCTVKVYADAGFATSPSVLVKAPANVQLLAKVKVPVLVLFRITLPKESLPQVKVVLVVEPSNVIVPEL